MIPIHNLLNRIRWDPEFAEGNFQLGYYDRAEDRIILVPLKELTIPEDSPQRFHLIDLQGHAHRIPFHRVREVYKDSQLIWHRPQPSREAKLEPTGGFNRLMRKHRRCARG